MVKSWKIKKKICTRVYYKRINLKMKPKIVLLGAGKFGKNHLRNLIDLDNKRLIQFVGVVDSDPKILSLVKKEYNVNTSSDYNDFLDLANAFDIVTPASTHYYLTKYFLKRKKHVFVEKPFTTNSKKSKELAILAKKNNLVLQVGHIFRYNEAVILLKKIIRKKGNFPFYISGKFLQGTEPRKDVGAIFNYLHHFDILDNLLGENPVKLSAYSNLNLTNPNREINAVIFLQYPKINAHLELGWIPDGKIRTLDIYSKNQYIKCLLDKQQIEIFKNNKLPKTICPKHKEPLNLELIEFTKCVRNGTQPTANGFVGARVDRIAELATISIKEKKEIKFSNVS